MLYKPKYCCNCSEKIEREVWNFKASSRFCQLCQTEFALLEWIPRLIVGFGIIGLIVGFSVFFQKPEKPLKISESKAERVKKDLPAQIAPSANETESNARALIQPATNSTGQKQKQAAAPQTFAQGNQPKPAENNLNSVEQVYFCGAATRKGTACSRRVRGGGRCWQHAGQPAILPPEKLIASR